MTHRLDDSEVRAEASVSPGTLDAEQDAVRGAAPACLGLPAVHAHAVQHPWCPQEVVVTEGLRFVALTDSNGLRLQW